MGQRQIIPWPLKKIDINFVYRNTNQSARSVLWITCTLSHLKAWMVLLLSLRLPTRLRSVAERTRNSPLHRPTAMVPPSGEKSAERAGWSSFFWSTIACNVWGTCSSIHCIRALQYLGLFECTSTNRAHCNVQCWNKNNSLIRTPH